MAESPTPYGLEKSRNLLLSTDSFDEQIHVSREFLAARSQFFSDIFERNVGKSHVHLKDVDGFALLSLLDVLYTGDLVHYKKEYMTSRDSNGKCHNMAGLFFGGENYTLPRLFRLAKEVGCYEMVKAAVLRLLLPVPCIEELMAVYRPSKENLTKVLVKEEGPFPGLEGAVAVVMKNLRFIMELPE